MKDLLNNVQLWQGFFALLFIWTALCLSIPSLADWVGTWLHAHSIAVTHWYRGVWAAFQAYRQSHSEVMKAEGYDASRPVAVAAQEPRKLAAVAGGRK